MAMTGTTAGSVTRGESLRLDGKVIVVTGAGRGIGRSHAKLLAERGAHVVVNDLGAERDGSVGTATPAQDTVAELNGHGLKAIADTNDVSDPAGAQALIAAALDANGRVDGVVNNAGIFSPMRTLEETTLQDFEKCWLVNLGGTYNVCKAAWPHFRAQGAGRIVNTTSLAGIYGAATNLDYSAAKGAVLAFSLALAEEGREHGIGVNVIAPGGLTRMMDGSMIEEMRPIMEVCLRPELVSPVVVWLMHDSTTVTAGVWEAVGGRVARVFTGGPEGLWDTDLTPESLAANAAVIDNPSGVVYRAGMDEWMQWEVGTSFALHTGERVG
jgi:NAD(P)-dependent dehydrogenase (short-subunit alcohol dehydrogenase family)